MTGVSRDDGCSCEWGVENGIEMISLYDTDCCTRGEVAKPVVWARCRRGWCGSSSRVRAG